ncbi:MAG TPA: aspartate/glutamate racemase family protein [Candidatus Angelobacter sp.]|nr:aspartate/glutamate racemase family protein [Candidatus Angelobacter sp.]
MSSLVLDQDNPIHKRRPPLWGILGGMGPLASTEFLNNIYRLSLERTEQDMPRVILLSDPSVPDRTTAIKSDEIEKVARDLQGLLARLFQMDVDHIVIACVTAHFFLPCLELPAPIKTRIISLISTIIDSLRVEKGKYLLLRTSGTRDARIFEGDPGWSSVSSRVCILNDKDQETIHHNYLYQLKKRSINADDLVLLNHLKAQYQVDGFIAGCTEVHLHTRELLANGMKMIDPLYVLAERIAQPASLAVSHTASDKQL